eukprot:5444654-Amphidinium_carterae.1
MACRDCKRSITSYKEKWSNLGTLRKQPSKPKTKRQAKREGKATKAKKGGHGLYRPWLACTPARTQVF